MIPVSWSAWLAHGIKDAPESGGGLIVAAIQLAIMLGATLGGVLFDMSGYQATFGMSAAVLVLAAGVALLAAQSELRAKPSRYDSRSIVKACA